MAVAAAATSVDASERRSRDLLANTFGYFRAGGEAIEPKHDREASLRCSIDKAENFQGTTCASACWAASHC
jgi:hypothetical protein